MVRSFEDVSILEFYKRQVSFHYVELLHSEEQFCYVETQLLIFLLIFTFYAVVQHNVFRVHIYIHYFSRVFSLDSAQFALYFLSSLTSSPPQLNLEVWRIHKNSTHSMGLLLHLSKSLLVCGGVIKFCAVTTCVFTVPCWPLCSAAIGHVIRIVSCLLLSF